MPARRDVLEGDAPTPRTGAGADRRTRGAAAGRTHDWARSGPSPELLRNRSGTRDRGATVLLSSHALSELEARAERVIMMDRGPDGRRRLHRRAEARGPAAGQDPPEGRCGSSRPPAGCRPGRVVGPGVLEIEVPGDRKIGSPAGDRVRTRSAGRRRCDPAVPRRSLCAFPAGTGSPPHEDGPHHGRQGDPGRAAQSLGPRHDAPDGQPRPRAHLPRQRSDRQRRRARARRGDREPVQPHHLPRAADRPPDRARRHRG